MMSQIGFVDDMDSLPCCLSGNSAAGVQVGEHLHGSQSLYTVDTITTTHSRPVMRTIDGKYLHFVIEGIYTNQIVKGHPL